MADRFRFRALASESGRAYLVERVTDEGGLEVAKVFRIDDADPLLSLWRPLGILEALAIIGAVLEGRAADGAEFSADLDQAAKGGPR